MSGWFKKSNRKITGLEVFFVVVYFVNKQRKMQTSLGWTSAVNNLSS